MAPYPLTFSRSPAVLLSLLALLLLSLTLRLLSLLPGRRPPSRRRRGVEPTRLLVVLGSGGHSAEMLAMLQGLDPRAYGRRSYVVSSGDTFSADKVREFEESLARRAGEERVGALRGAGGGTEGEICRTNGGTGQRGEEKEEGEEPKEREAGSYDITFVPRARRIHQPLFTTPVSALQCLWACLRLLRAPPSHSPSQLAQQASAAYPDLILTNGPGTAVVVILASFILRFLDVDGANSRGSMRAIYVESWARVKRLSLSGKLLVRVVDRFVVQWEGLEGVAGRGEFLGVLI